MKLPGVGVTVNGARRWLGAGPLVFQPSELAKLALVLYAAKFLAQKPGRITSPRAVTPVLLVAGTMILLVASQPDLGTALVIAFTLSALLVAGGLPVRFLGMGAGGAAFLIMVFAIVEPYRRARLTRSWIPGATRATRASRRCRGRSRWARAGSSAAAWASRCRRSSTCPRPTPTSSWPSSARSSASSASSRCCASTAWSPTPACASPRPRAAPTPSCWRPGITSLILSQACLNVFAVLGLAPLTGVPLPFISYGATNLTVLLAGMGLLLNVAGGGTVPLRVVTGSRRGGAEDDRDRRRRDSRARGAGAGGRGRAAG